MANVSYTPTFRHFAWRDRLDRVVAAGPNGFNVRFAAIERDLRQVSTVVDQVGTEIDRITANVVRPARERRLIFTPTFQDVREGPPFSAGWEMNSEGFPTQEGRADIPEHQLIVKGVVNLDLPHGARFVSLHMNYEIGGDPNVALDLELNRTPLRPTPPPVATEDLASTSLTLHPRTGAFEIDLPVRSASLATVDLDAFRYFLFVAAGAPARVASSIIVRTIELRYVA